MTEVKRNEAALRAAHDALDRLNRELEARVEARTRELQLANQRLEELASIDPLTAVSNRRHFLELASPEISRAKRQGLPLAVIMFMMRVLPFQQEVISGACHGSVIERD